MNCEHAQSLLLDLLYDEEPVTHSAALQEHIDECATCRAAWQEMRSARGLLEDLAAQDDDCEQIPLDVAAMMAAAAASPDAARSPAPIASALSTSAPAVAASVARRSASSRTWSFGAVIALAACLALVAALVLGLRVNWTEGGVQLAWGTPAETANNDLAAALSEVKATQERLTAQQQRIDRLESALASQNKNRDDLIAALNVQFRNLQLQLERSDFRISVLKANVHDLGSVLARFATVRPVNAGTTSGEE